VRREKRAEPACYNSAMTAKQALLELVETMSEEEAEEVLARIEWEATEFEELTPEEAAEVEVGRAEFAAGHSVSADEYFKRLKV